MIDLAMLAGVFLEGVARPLLILHAVSATVLTGAMTHEFVCLVAHLRGRLQRYELEKTYRTVAFFAALATWLTGALVYPAYRVNVRANVFDRTPEMSWLTGLFEVKENWASLLLAMLCCLFLIGRQIDLQRDREPARIYVLLGLLAFGMVWSLALAGLYLAIREGV